MNSNSLNMKCCLFFLAFFLFNQKNISGQDKSVIQFGDVSVKDFMLPASPVADSSSGGIIMADIGKTYFIGNEYRSFSYVFKKHTRILIAKNNAFDLATIKFSLYVYGEKKSRLDEIKAAVYNLENGNVIKTEFNKGDLFEEKLNSYTSGFKLILPGVKEGSIIEYSYQVTSYRYYDIPDWYFQHRYPCLYSEYEVVYPNALRYLVTNYGVDSFYKRENSTVKNNKYYMADLTVISDDIKQKWVMKDIPSMNDEKFMYSLNDYLDKVEFTLAQTYNGEDIKNLRTSWYMVAGDLLEETYFGKAIDKEHAVNLMNTVEKVTAKDKDLLESARSIYRYVRDNFTCLDDDGIYLTGDLYDINKKRKGNVADLNLLLVALLRQKGIDADPVLLSTREFGKNSPQFPLLEKMNYVICMARVFGDTIYLDATKPLLGFGQLPLDCYNGHARIINNLGSPVYFDPEDIKELNSTAVFIANENNGKSGGWVENEQGMFGSEKIRTEIKESGFKNYFDNISSEFTNETNLLNPGIDSLVQTDFPVKVHFDLNFPFEGDVLYFNPVVFTAYKQNPFKPEKRKYPVSFSMPVNELYTLNMEIPEGYMIDELPKQAKVSFNENEGVFEYLIQANQKSIQLRSRISLPKVFYPSEDYQSLRDFYTFIVAKYSEQIVFKKKK
jgi:transglutaminase-like putative cysteine protease